MSDAEGEGLANDTAVKARVRRVLSFIFDAG